MNKIDSLFTDIRNAFRLLNSYQKRVLSIVDYIRCQSPFTDMWGAKDWYSSEIGRRRNSPDPDYAKLSVYKDMWGWDFLYGYIFEYYFGAVEIEKKHVEMSVFQLSDDGWFISKQEKKHMTKVNTFEDADKSHTYIVFNMTITPKNVKEGLWLKDPAYPNDEWKDFLTKFFSSSSDTKITSSDKGSFSILKKYEMQNFTSQTATDAVIRDFDTIVREKTGISVFNTNRE